MSEVLYEVVDHVATVTLNAPERMNTISGPMLHDLSARLLDADRDRDVRCVVLTGAGRAFCAGLDLGAQMAGGSDELGNLGEIGSNPGEFEIRDAPPIVLHTSRFELMRLVTGRMSRHQATGLKWTGDQSVILDALFADGFFTLQPNDVVEPIRGNG